MRLVRTLVAVGFLVAAALGATHIRENKDYWNLHNVCANDVLDSRLRTCYKADLPLGGTEVSYNEQGDVLSVTKSTYEGVVLDFRNVMYDINGDVFPLTGFYLNDPWKPGSSLDFNRPQLEEMNYDDVILRVDADFSREVERFKPLYEENFGK